MLSAIKGLKAIYNPIAGDFSILPVEMIDYIIEFLDIRDARALFLASSYFYSTIPEKTLESKTKLFIENDSNFFNRDKLIKKYTNFKVVIIGDKGSGKKSLFYSCFPATSKNYVQSCVKTKNIFRNKAVCKVQVWVAAWELKKSVKIYRGSSAILLLVDLTTKNKFLINNIKLWQKEVERYMNESPLLLVVANKCDLAEDEKVAENYKQNLETLRKFSTGENKLFELITGVSGKTGQGVTELFEKTINFITEKKAKEEKEAKEESKKSGSEQGRGAQSCVMM